MDRIEETLDPKNWEKMKVLAKQMAEDMVTYLETIEERPILRPKTEEILDYLKQPAPEKPLGPTNTYQEFQEKILNNRGSLNAHPCCWAAVTGQGSSFGALADMWSSGINAIMNEHDITPDIETQVIRWIKEMLDYPMAATGVLGSGGTMANLIGLNVALNSNAGYDVNKNGVNGKLTFYGSTEVHFSIIRNLRLMGIGHKNLRLIPVDNDYRIDLSLLKEQVDKDRDEGYTPVCVVGCCGSTNVGAIDDLESLASYCKREELWYHVDGAFGAWVHLSPKYRHMVKGQDKADSLALDLHKWMYMPYGIGCTLVKDADAHYRTFDINPVYLEEAGSGSGSLSLEGSRPSRSLKAWMTIKEHGVGKFRRLVEMNIDQAKYLGELVEDSPNLELVAPVNLNVVCFRYYLNGLGEDKLAKLNYGVFNELFRNPKFAVLPSKLNGKVILRACITNHRTRYEHLDSFIGRITQIGNKLVK